MQIHKYKLIKSLLLGIVITSATVWANSTPIQARSPIPLLNAKCVSSGEGNVREQKQNVSIGKAVYTSLFFLGPGYRSAAMTCRIRPENRPNPVFQTLNLGFGIRDNDADSPNVQVNIFVDGQQVESRSIAPAQAQNVVLDVSQASNIAIEATCTSGVRFCPRVHFFRANLERIPRNAQKQN